MMSKKKSERKQNRTPPNSDDNDDLKKYIDKNEAQQKVLEKITQVLKEKKKNTN